MGGLKLRFVGNLCSPNLNLKIYFHMPIHVERRLFDILVGVMSFTGVVLNFKVEDKSRETIQNNVLQGVPKRRIFQILVFTRASRAAFSDVLARSCAKRRA